MKWKSSKQLKNEIPKGKKHLESLLDMIILLDDGDFEQ